MIITSFISKLVIKFNELKKFNSSPHDSPRNNEKILGWEWGTEANLECHGVPELKKVLVPLLFVIVILITLLQLWPVFNTE